jgi:hypothetical protein
MSESPEKRIIDIRNAEAVKLNLTGLDGKLGCIAKNLGQPIIAQYDGGKYYSSTEWDYLNYNDTDELPCISDGREFEGDCSEINDGLFKSHNKKVVSTENVGWFYDGTNYGFHLEIKCNLDGEIIVYYKGYKVYEEVPGELKRFNPNGDWLSIINKLHETAKLKERDTKKVNRQKQIEENEQNKVSWIKQMREKWGI